MTHRRGASAAAWLAVVAWAALIFTLSAQSMLPDLTQGLPDLQDIAGHLLAYAGLAFWLLQALQRERGLSYLLITHDVDVIRAMAHAVLVMKDGAVVESGPVAQVLDAPQHDYTRVLVAAAA